MRLSVGPGSSTEVGDQVGFCPAQHREHLCGFPTCRAPLGTPSAPPTSSPQALSLSGPRPAHPQGPLLSAPGTIPRLRMRTPARPLSPAAW